MGWFSKRIYADAAGAMPVQYRARRRFEELSRLFGNPGGLHQEAQWAKEELELARRQVADCIGAHADEIYFTSGGTEANNLAVLGVLSAASAVHGAVHGVTSAIEHPSVLEPFAAIEGEDVSAARIEPDREGLVSPKQVRDSITERTALVSVQTVNSEIGTRQPVEDIAKAVRSVRKARGTGDVLPLYVHTDASQSPLWEALDVKKLGVDLMTLDAQKIGGVRGTGCLYVKRNTHIQPIIFGGRQEKGLRAGTEPVALAGAFAEALRTAQEDAVKNAARIGDVRTYLVEEIRARIPDAALNGSPKSRVANNANVSIPDLDGELAIIVLNARGIAASTRSACGTGDEEPSYVVAALGESWRARSAIRFTLLPTATYTDMRRIARELGNISRMYRAARTS